MVAVCLRDTDVRDCATGSWSPTVSPDSRRVACVSDRGGLPRPWILDVERERAYPLDVGPHPVTRVHWSRDGAWLACVIAPGGAPRSELWLVRPDGADLHQVGGFGTATARFGAWAHGGSCAGPSPSAALVFTESGETSEIVVLDADSGARRTVASGRLLSVLDLSRDGRRVLLRRGPRGRGELAVLDLADGSCRPVDVGPGDGSTDLALFSPDASVVYARTDVGREFTALVVVPVDAPLDGHRGPTLVAECPDGELDEFALSDDGRRLALVWNVDGGRSALTVLDLATSRTYPVAPLPGSVVTDCEFAGDARLVMTAEGPGQPRDIWSVDLDSGLTLPVDASTARLAASGPAGPAAPASGTGGERPEVSVPELRWLRAHDGTPISGWLYLPTDRPTTGRLTDRPAGNGPWPTVVYLHGGPEAQERPVHSPLFQLLARSGIAVFTPNVRGSSGFGRTFVNADNLSGRFDAIQDVADCAAYLISSGVAEAGRLGCMGRSYGGYLTLAAAVAFPDLFAAGVDICGISNFATFYAHTEPWIASAAVSKYGHPEHDRELLRTLSPLHRFDRVVTPMLVIHGANDTNVPVCEAEQVVAAAEARGLPHRYLTFTDEGHEFHNPANRARLIEETVRWLLAYLRSPAVPERVDGGVQVA